MVNQLTLHLSPVSAEHDTLNSTVVERTKGISEGRSE